MVYNFNSNPDNEKVFEKKGITIYDLDPSENKNHFKAVYMINTNIDYFKRMVLDPKNQEQWLNNIKRAENIRNINDSIIYTYIIISVKSVFKKEAVVKTTVQNNPGGHYARIVQKIDTSMKYDSQYEKLTYGIYCRMENA